MSAEKSYVSPAVDQALLRAMITRGEAIPKAPNIQKGPKVNAIITDSTGRMHVLSQPGNDEGINYIGNR